MHICLWDTNQRGISKDFAGGYGVGMFNGTASLRQRIIRWGYQRDRRPVALNFAYLAAIFRRLGHTVEYCVDRLPSRADVFIFNPALQTIELELQGIKAALKQAPRPRVLVVGAVAHALPDSFALEGVTVLRGEPEQLLGKLQEVLDSDQPVVDVGTVKDLDNLPWPDWSVFPHRRFSIRYDFTRFPTGLVQQSRGCTFTCNYCPYIAVENRTRFRSPEQVAAEMEHGIRQYGFQSFKFRDPLFGLDRRRALRLAELIGHLPRRIQFSIESRIDLLRLETLQALRDVGLTAITVGIETPNEDTLRQYQRLPIRDDRQQEFVELCRRLGIRTVAGFMIGFPEDTERTIQNVLNYACKVNPTYANFNIVTPYPGTEFFQQIKSQIADPRLDKYDVYHPVLQYRNLTAEQVSKLHGRCFERFYFRMRYLRANAHLLWPSLRRFGVGSRFTKNPLPANNTVQPSDSRSPESATKPKTATHEKPGSQAA
ncbi:MAG: radical SAM protein [Pirellulales bacterium]|nr:radical SAM protein [Pirellulales bacterium]